MSIFELINTAPWTEQAKCREVYPDEFFPPDDAPIQNKQLAKRVCAVCPVAAECLAAGMDERHGIWGGKTVRERNALRRAGRK